MGYKTTFRGPSYINGTWTLKDNVTLGSMLMPNNTATYEGLTFSQILNIYEQNHEECPCPLIENIQYFIETGEIEKFIYTDMLCYRQNSNPRYCNIYYNSLVYQGLDSSGRYSYVPYCYNQGTSQYQANFFNGMSISQGGFSVSRQPLLFGYIPCINTISFSEDLNVFKIPDTYTRKTYSQSEDLYYFEDTNNNSYQDNANALYLVRNYIDENDSNKNGMYQKVAQSTEDAPCLWKYITSVKHFFSNYEAIAQVYFIPIALNRSTSTGYIQVPMKCAVNSQGVFPNHAAMQTLEESAYNQALINRTEPVNWLDIKKNLGVP